MGTLHSPACPFCSAIGGNYPAFGFLVRKYFYMIVVSRLYWKVENLMLNRIIDKLKKDKTVFAVVIGSAVICFWRGLWGLMDNYLFPENYALSAIASFSIGLGVLLFTGYAREELA